MKRGQVYYADLRPVIGCEQGGIRPCVIIQNDAGNQYSSTVIVAMMTTQTKKELPTHISVSPKDYCLDSNTTILLEQLRTIDKSRLKSFVGRLSEGTMRRVDEALHISLALNKEEREAKEMEGMQIFNNEALGFRVRAMMNDDGSISVNAEDTAVGFGWTQTQTKSGKQYVSIRWETLNGYCEDFGFPNKVGKDDYIPESLFYRLAMKASNDRADRFQDWLAKEVIPKIRQTGGYQMKPMSPEQMMRVQLGMIDKQGEQIKDHESRIENLENNTTLDYGQQRVLEDTVNKTVIDVLGGKESNAYKEISKKVFAECNHDLKSYFKVNARANVPKKRFEEAVAYAENWKPCTNTMMRIADCNAQMNI